MSPTLVALLASLSLSLSMILLLYWLPVARRATGLEARVEGISVASQSVEEFELSLPFSERFLLPVLRVVGGKLASRTPSERMAQIRRKLVLAGNPKNLSVAEFMALRVVAALVLGPMMAGLLALAGQKLSYVLGALALGSSIGYFYPNAYIKRKIKERQKAIERALPDSIDLVTICVEAGLAFDLALKRVTEKWQNQLSEEFNRVLTDMRLGRSRRDALKDMVGRTGVDDLANLVSAIIQADQLGVGIVQVLRIQSEQLRQRRRQRAEEKAQKAPVKIIFPMVLFIFPAIYVVILGPAIPKVLESFK